MLITEPPTYDSAAPGRPVAREIAETWRFRQLLGVLVRRDVVLRYKRSALGLWWALLTPLLRTMVMWIVLSQIFRAQPLGVPYIVYLFSGVVVFAFFEQAVMSAGSSIVDNSGLIAQIHVPAQVFALSAVSAAAVTFGMGMIVLAIVQVAAGVGLAWSWLLLPLPFAALAATATGVGLLLASAAVRFYDVMNIATVVLGLLAFATPTFYPLSAINPDFQWIIELNPLTSFLEVFRALAYGGDGATTASWLVCAGTAVGSLALGMYVFARTWRTAALWV